jgi:hypothetical protein
MSVNLIFTGHIISTSLMLCKRCSSRTASHADNSFHNARYKTTYEIRSVENLVTKLTIPVLASRRKYFGNMPIKISKKNAESLIKSAINLHVFALQSRFDPYYRNVLISKCRVAAGSKLAWVQVNKILPSLDTPSFKIFSCD